MKDKLKIIDLSPDDSLWNEALPVLQQLRPLLTADLFRQIYGESYMRERVQYTVGLDNRDECLVVMGWRILNKTAVRMLYIDDLVVSEKARGTGIGKVMMEEMTKRANEAGCGMLALDTGAQRVDAQRFYENFGMKRDKVYLYLKELSVKKETT